MILFLFFSVSMFLAGFLSFSLNRKHLLMMLLSLELVMLSLFFNVYLYLGFFYFEFYFALVFLTMAVCEGVLGLAILVMMMRSFGNDYINSFNLLW